MKKQALLALALVGVMASGDAFAAQRRQHHQDETPIYGWPFGPDDPETPPYPQYGSMCDYPRLLRFYGDDITARRACHGLLFN